MVKRLNKSFYTREDVVQISKDLLGKYLVTHINGKLTAGKIVETEAYRAPDDKASHAYNNRRTARTETMFAEGGKAYVYLCYGIHHMFNIVTGKKDMPHAVLLRGLQPVDNIEAMLLRRNMGKIERRLTAGPGMLSQALGIKTSFSGTDLTTADSPIWLEDRGEAIAENNILASPRVGIGYAEECIGWPWRFRVKGSKWTSPAK
ncbi:MAG TPA: DNA-3-methyladenine glycosylase [Bacteroidetes bacterium]|nr:DNA-3-methyladenine glycosylase [Bacteroidota bacterium]